MNDEALTAPNRTAVTPVNPLPVSVTTDPAAPDAGLTEPITGAATAYVNATPLLVPAGVVTVTCTVPDPAGTVAVICVADTTVNDEALTAPNRTAVTPVNPLPVSVTTDPAAPDAGLTEPITGAATAYVNATPLLVPAGVVTVTCTVPDPAGTVAVICVADTTVNDEALTAPNRTAVTPVNPLPVSVTTDPAAPDAGLTEPITGAATAYVNATPLLVAPHHHATTVTCTVPDPAGTVAVIWVSDSTVNDEALTAPNRTAVTPSNPLPVSVTTDPAAPDAGLTEPITGML
ncbi:hypothetical protein BG452_05355 [Streptomyces sp. CBMA123]|nr:hypothetical protein [Streptomyces sp. CBMA123]